MITQTPQYDEYFYAPDLVVDGIIGFLSEEETKVLFVYYLKNEGNSTEEKIEILFENIHYSDKIFFNPKISELDQPTKVSNYDWYYQFKSIWFRKGKNLKITIEVDKKRMQEILNVKNLELGKEYYIKDRTIKNKLLTINYVISLSDEADINILDSLSFFDKEEYKDLLEDEFL